MLSVKECQNIELEIMRQYHEFCEANKLRYMLVYGSLLGAIRHQGFIPWDNDMDVAMPRPDFELFLELLKTQPIGKDLYHVHYTTDLKYHYQVIRICDANTKVTPPYIREQPLKMGVWIDIFPLDGVCVNPYAHLIHFITLRFLQILQKGDIYGLRNGKGFKKKIKYFIHKVFPGKNNKHEYAIDYEVMKYPYELTDNVGVTIELDPVFRFSKQNIDNRRLAKFEKYQFYIPENWDAYLTFTYGNYMELPSEEHRMTHDIHAEYIQ